MLPMERIDEWMERYRQAVTARFGARVLLVGLQGSYGRGEAGEGSDIDVALILDRLDAADLLAYRRAIAALPCRGQVCGFVSGRAELSNWSAPELFQFYYDTRAYQGSLDLLIPRPTRADAREAALTGACGIYHGCCHNYVHAADAQALKALFKGAVFVLQAKRFHQTGEYVKSHAALGEVLTGADRTVFEAARRCKKEGVSAEDFEAYSALLIEWAGALIRGFGAAA